MRWVAAFGLVVAVAAGCGYRLVRYEGSLGDVRSVAIPTLRNDSYEPGVELVVSDALRREFLRRGAVRLTENPDAADLVVSGAVDYVSIAGRSFNSVVMALEYQLTIGLELQARRADGTELPIDGRALSETEIYLASADIEASRKNRDEAVRRVASLLAARVHDALDEALVP